MDGSSSSIVSGIAYSWGGSASSVVPGVEREDKGVAFWTVCSARDGAAVDGPPLSMSGAFAVEYSRFKHREPFLHIVELKGEWGVLDELASILAHHHCERL